MKSSIQKNFNPLKVSTVLQVAGVGGLIVLLGYLSFHFTPFWIITSVVAVVVAWVIFKNPWNGFLLFAFFIPFERIGSVDISGVTVRISQVTAIFTMISFVLWFLAQRKWNLPKIPIALPLAGFICAVLLGLLNAPNLERSLLVSAFTLFTFCVGIMVPFLVLKKEHIQQVISVMLFSMFLVTLFGLYQFFGDLLGLPPEFTGLRELYTKDVLGFPRVQSTALEPLYFANYLLVPLAILLSLFLSRDKSMKQYTVIVLLGLGLVNLVLTVARGGYIALVPVVIILLGYYFFRLFTWRNLFYASVSFGIVIITASLLLDFSTVSDQFVMHVSNLFGGASYSERLEMFTVAERAWRDHPFVGIGSGSFGPYESAHPYLVPDHGWRIVNNEYLELLAENGLLGAASMILVFLVLIVRSVKALTKATDPYLKSILVAFLAGFVGILVQYNTFSILYIVHIWFTIGMLIAIQNIVLNQER